MWARPLLPPPLSRAREQGGVRLEGRGSEAKADVRSGKGCLPELYDHVGR